MNIAILGFGTVGSGVYEIISRDSKKMEHLRVLKVLDLPQNKDKLHIITSNINDITDNPEIDLVVETMGGIHPAYEFICNCLKAKKHVVTANKAVVAKHLQEFLALAKENGVSFMFEACVGGGIPWLASLMKASRIDDINHFYGIFNGTSNFILDHMISYEKDFMEALQLAQELGYAEADPSADIDGYDVQNKVVISSNLAFSTNVDMADFTVFGMRNVSIHDIRYLASKGLGVKYIGEALKCESKYEAFVMPNIFKASDVEANIRTNFNIAALHGNSIGTLKFYGQGAGKLPTANAIIQDILDIGNDNCYVNAPEKFALTYSDELTKNVFLIRTTHGVEDSPHIDSLDTYESLHYIVTKEMTTKEFKVQFNEIIEKDDKVFVAKFANLD